MKKNRILSLNGGGYMGKIIWSVLIEIYKMTGKNIAEYVDLFVGTSIGGWTALALAANRFKDDTVLMNLDGCTHRTFSERRPFPALYSRKHIRATWESMYGNMRLEDLEKKCIVTYDSANDGMTHFLKSYAEHEKDILARDAGMYTSAAPWYLGAINSDRLQCTVLDGGVGRFNCPVEYAYDEALALDLAEIYTEDDDMIKQDCHILHIGTGLEDLTIPYSKTKKWRNIRETLYYMSIKDGGYARRGAVQQAYNQVKYRAENDNSDIKVSIIDGIIPHKIIGMDKIKYRDEYNAIGKRWFKSNKDLILKWIEE